MLIWVELRALAEWKHLKRRLALIACASFLHVTWQMRWGGEHNRIIHSLIEESESKKTLTVKKVIFINVGEICNHVWLSVSQECLISALTWVPTVLPTQTLGVWRYRYRWSLRRFQTPWIIMSKETTLSKNYTHIIWSPPVGWRMRYWIQPRKI